MFFFITNEIFNLIFDFNVILHSCTHLKNCRKHALAEPVKIASPPTITYFRRRRRKEKKEIFLLLLLLLLLLFLRQICDIGLTALSWISTYQIICQCFVQRCFFVHITMSTDSQEVISTQISDFYYYPIKEILLRLP